MISQVSFLRKPLQDRTNYTSKQTTTALSKKHSNMTNIKEGQKQHPHEADKGIVAPAT
jgi:hypothetical protein